MIDVAIEVYESFAAVMASQNQVPVQLFLCQINQESGFNPTITSPAGAVGIAQIVPKWHPGVDPLDPFASMAYAANLMSAHYTQFKRWDLALAAYNAGAGAVQQYNGIPPFPETQNYVKAIMECSAT